MTADTPPEYCPVARTLNLIGDRWSLLIIRDAFDGIHRFSDFQRNLHVARNILSDRLRKLTEAGILETQPAADGSAYQEYRLTASGEALFTTIVALRQWGEAHLFTAEEPRSVLTDSQGRLLSPLTVTTADGETAVPAETVVRKVSG